MGGGDVGGGGRGGGPCVFCSRDRHLTTGPLNWLDREREGGREGREGVRQRERKGGRGREGGREREEE